MADGSKHGQNHWPERPKLEGYALLMTYTPDKKRY